MFRLLFAASILCLLAFSGARAGDEPKKKPDAETIPAPQIVQPATEVIIAPAPQRSDSIDVWQHYGVNRQGRFVPRVIVLPYGAYYSRDLQPYPWVQNHPGRVMPYVVD